MLRFIQFFEAFDPDKIVLYSIGQISPQGSVESKDFPKGVPRQADYRFGVTHDQTFTRKAPASQRFRLMKDNKFYIWWDDEPTRSDYFTVDDYYANMGYKIDRHTIYMTQRLNPQKLTEEYSPWQWGSVSSSGAVTTANATDHEDLWTNTHENMGLSNFHGFRYENGAISWNEDPTEDERIAVENYYAPRPVRHMTTLIGMYDT